MPSEHGFTPDEAIPEVAKNSLPNSDGQKRATSASANSSATEASVPAPDPLTSLLTEPIDARGGTHSSGEQIPSAPARRRRRAVTNAIGGAVVGVLALEGAHVLPSPKPAGAETPHVATVDAGLQAKYNQQGLNSNIVTDAVDSPSAVQAKKTLEKLLPKGKIVTIVKGAKEIMFSWKKRKGGVDVAEPGVGKVIHGKYSHTLREGKLTLPGKPPLVDVVTGGNDALNITVRGNNLSGKQTTIREQAAGDSTTLEKVGSVMTAAEHSIKITVSPTPVATTEPTPTATIKATYTATEVPPPTATATFNAAAQPLIEKVYPFINKDSSVDLSKMQADLDRTKKLFADYGIDVQFHVQSAITDQIPTTAPVCSVNYIFAQYDYLKQKGDVDGSANIVMYNSETYQDCVDANGPGAGTNQDTVNGKLIHFSAINIPDNAPLELAHELAEQLNISISNESTDSSNQAVADAYSNITQENGDELTSRNNKFGLSLVAQIEAGLNPTVESMTTGEKTFQIEPRAQMDKGLKGIKLPFTVDGEVQDLYVQFRDPKVGGDSLIDPTAPLQVVCSVWNGKGEIEIPPLNKSDKITNTTDHWTLTVEDMSSYATVNVQFTG